MGAIWRSSTATTAWLPDAPPFGRGWRRAVRRGHHTRSAWSCAGGSHAIRCRALTAQEERKMCSRGSAETRRRGGVTLAAITASAKQPRRPQRPVHDDARRLPVTHPLRAFAPPREQLFFLSRSDRRTQSVECRCIQYHPALGQGAPRPTSPSRHSRSERIRRRSTIRSAANRDRAVTNRTFTSLGSLP